VRLDPIGMVSGSISRLIRQVFHSRIRSAPVTQGLENSGTTLLTQMEGMVSEFLTAIIQERIPVQL
jgi:hypothetical protein